MLLLKLKADSAGKGEGKIVRSRAVKRKECSTLVWKPAGKETSGLRSESAPDRQGRAAEAPAAENVLAQCIHKIHPQAREKAVIGFWGQSRGDEAPESFWSARQRLAAAWLKRSRDSRQVRRGPVNSRFRVQQRVKLSDVDWLAVVWGWVAALAVTLAVLIGAALYVAFTPGSVFLLSAYLFLNKVVSPLLGGFLAGIRNRGNVFSAGFLVGLGYGMAVVVFRLYGGLFSVFWAEALLSLLGSLGGGIAGAWLGMALFSASAVKSKDASAEADSVPAVLTNRVGIVKIHGNNG